MSRARTHLRVVLVAVLTTLAVTATTTTAAHAEPTASELTKDIEKASHELEGLVESHNKLKEELKQTKEAETKLGEQMKPVQDQLNSASGEVAAIAAQAYRQAGAGGQASVLLTGDSGFLDRLVVLEHLSRKRQRQVDTYAAANQQFAVQQGQLTTARQRQEAQIAEMDARKGKIEADLKKLMDMRRQAYGREQEEPTRYTGSIPQISGAAGTAVAFAYGAIGKPYVWGAAGPGGYDCSGLTKAAWAAAGKSLPHNAAMQHGQVARITRDQLQPGDLVFYRGDQHVAIYVGDNKIIDAATFGVPIGLRPLMGMTPNGYGRVR